MPRVGAPWLGRRFGNVSLVPAKASPKSVHDCLPTATSHFYTKLRLFLQLAAMFGDAFAFPTADCLFSRAFLLFLMPTAILSRLPRKAEPLRTQALRKHTKTVRRMGGAREDARRICCHQVRMRSCVAGLPKLACDVGMSACTHVGSFPLCFPRYFAREFRWCWRLAFRASCVANSAKLCSLPELTGEAGVPGLAGMHT